MDNLNPNCSEATCRLKIDNLTDKEEECVDVMLKDLEENNEDWGDTSYSTNTIFGIRVIEIKGNYPYNNDTDLANALDKLPFRDKFEVEFDD